MNFLQQRSRTRGRGRLGALRPLIFAVLIVVGVLGIDHATFGTLSRTIHRVGVPVWHFEASVVEVYTRAITTFKSKAGLQEENRRLREEIVRLELASLSTEVLRVQNEDLKELVGRGERDEYVAAAILSRPGRTLYDTFIIDVGRKDGITTDALVFAADSVALGVVTQVYADSSVVTLYSMPGRESEVVLNTEDPVVAYATGRGGGDFEIHIPRGVSVSEGDVVSLPGLEGSVLGIVGEVSALPADSFQTILVANPVNLRTLRIVGVTR